MIKNNLVFDDDEQTNKNKNIINNLIAEKQFHKPSYVNFRYTQINNQNDIFPYPKWFKGNPDSNEYFIAEREAGFAPKRKYTIDVKKPLKEENTTCFQAPCSTVFPCYNQESNYYSMNKACISAGKYN
jgi:hypothetical protein